MSWEEISPDLSLNDKSRQGHSGGDITRESAGAEVHATCACVVESPHRKGEIWASTDDGLVHVTRDDGASWQNVTPPDMPELAYVGCVEISAHDPDTVYVAATRYKLADYRPYLFRSTDGGRSWQSISGDFPGQRDHPRGARRSGPTGAAVRRHRDRRSSSASTTDRPGRACPADCRSFRSTISRSRVLIWSPARTAARSGSSTTSRRCARSPTACAERGCSRRAQRSVPSCISARWAACERPSPSLSPSASAAASPPSSGPTAPECASISTSARTRRMARSSITGSTTTCPDRSPSPSVMRPARPSSRCAAMMTRCRWHVAPARAVASTASCGT